MSEEHASNAASAPSKRQRAPEDTILMENVGLKRHEDTDALGIGSKVTALFRLAPLNREGPSNDTAAEDTADDSADVVRDPSTLAQQALVEAIANEDRYQLFTVLDTEHFDNFNFSACGTYIKLV
eukprot:3238633-Pyramimonas_sp.AAC.2